MVSVENIFFSFILLLLQNGYQIHQTSPIFAQLPSGSENSVPYRGIRSRASRVGQSGFRPASQSDDKPTHIWPTYLWCQYLRYWRTLGRQCLDIARRKSTKIFEDGLTRISTLCILKISSQFMLSQFFCDDNLTFRTVDIPSFKFFLLVPKTTYV